MWGSLLEVGEAEKETVLIWERAMERWVRNAAVVAPVVGDWDDGFEDGFEYGFEDGFEDGFEREWDEDEEEGGGCLRRRFRLREEEGWEEEGWEEEEEGEGGSLIQRAEHTAE